MILYVYAEYPMYHGYEHVVQSFRETRTRFIICVNLNGSSNNDVADSDLNRESKHKHNTSNKYIPFYNAPRSTEVLALTNIEWSKLKTMQVCQRLCTHTC